MSYFDDYKNDLVRYNGSETKYIKMLMYSFRRSKRDSAFSRLWRILYRILAAKNHLEISPTTRIGAGLYIGHPYCITINPKAILGQNVNIHKGVTIGQENRGCRKGTPIIGNSVWIGVNATIVGNITIGDDVLIAPNTYVNCDIPSHSIVFGNPCIVKPSENATHAYVNYKFEDSVYKSEL